MTGRDEKSRYRERASKKRVSFFWGGDEGGQEECNNSACAHVHGRIYFSVPTATYLYGTV